MKYTLFIIASFLIITAIPAIAKAANNTGIPSYAADIQGTSDMTRDTTTTLEATGGNPNVNQTIQSEDYIVDDTPAKAPDTTSDETLDETTTFTRGPVSSGNVEDYVDLDALEDRATNN